MKRVLFVCTGNICRSPLAEALLRRELAARGQEGLFEVDSAGIAADHLGQQADPRMRRTAASHGVTVDHRARRAHRSEMSAWDLVVGMDDLHVSALESMADGHPVEIRKMREFDPEVSPPPSTPTEAPDVPDPWYGGQRGFDEVYAMVDRSCAVLADRIVVEYEQ